MKHTKASDRIRLNDGEVVTLGEALDRKILVLRKTDNMYSRRSGLRTAYFAEYPDTGEGWEISKGLYLSRTSGFEIEGGSNGRT